MNRSRAWLLAGGFALMAVLVLAGCAGRGAGLSSDPSVRITWPPPPAEARIEFVRSFSSPEDLGIKKLWIKRFFSYLARGREQRHMRRPYGVTSTPGGILAVADPGEACVHLFDTVKSRYLRLEGPKEQPFVSPVGVAPGPDGLLHVSDSVLGLVFRYQGDGQWASPLGEEEGLARPTGLAWGESSQRLYVVETGEHRISVFDALGEPAGRFGRRGAGEGEFNYPVAVAVGPGGKIFVSDSMNFRVQIFSAAGEFEGSFGEPGTSPGEMDKSKGIAVDGDGHIYLADALHDVVQVFDGSGRLLTVIGGTGREPGLFWLPSGLHIDGEGRILVADSANGRVQVLRYLGESAGVAAQ